MQPGLSSYRVLLGPLAPVVRLGMGRALASQAGVDVVGDEADADAAINAAARLRPDAVVLRDAAGTDALCDRFRAVVPQAKLILWRGDEDGLDVLDPGTAVPRRCAATAAEGLRVELRPSTTTRQE